jgi:hypothetical protein
MSIQIPTSYSLQEALSAIGVHWKGLAGNTTTLQFTYDGRTVEMSMFDTSNNPLVFEIKDPKDVGHDHETDAFFQMLNVEGAPTFSDYTLKSSYTFRNVWNRKDLFLHASFVSNTTAGYLGRSGEFYPKPSKIYPLTDETNFTIELSFDGHNKTTLHHENFMLELCFILDTDSYIAE